MQPSCDAGVHPVRFPRKPDGARPTMLHNTSPANRLTRALAAAGLLLALGVAGCLHTQNDELTNGVISGERPVAMEGTQAFFGGRVSVKVTLSRGIGRGLRKGGREKGDYTYSSYTENENKTLVGSPLPPVTLHLILTNTSPEAVKVTMLDFDSDMGNFAIDPEMLALKPGETGEPTPMVSQLGVTADAMDFKVTLKLGTVRESKTFSVKIIAPDPALAPAPPRS
jgi:hypothetical protein